NSQLWQFRNGTLINKKSGLALDLEKEDHSNCLGHTGLAAAAGWFFIKNQKHGTVLGVSNVTKEGTKIVASALDKKNYETQLWKFEDGFLWNKASKFVLDYTAKTSDADNQHWALTQEGFIFSRIKPNLVLALKDTVGRATLNLYIQEKKSHDHGEQRWNFVIPTIKGEQPYPVLRTFETHP
ncbi:hypothetical protein BC938DRAFT_476277, partial [Jimgerdemannia flammicorona]